MLVVLLTTALLPPAQAAPTDAVVRFPAGTGFLASRTGLVLTCDHVATASRSRTVVLASGRRARAALVQRIPALDLAVFRVPPSTHPTWLSLDPAPLTGTEALSIVGLQGTPTPREASCASQRPEQLGDVPVTAHDCPVWWGSSGSALLDEAGHVRAVHFGWEDVAGEGLAVQLTPLRRFLRPELAQEMGLVD